MRLNVRNELKQTYGPAFRLAIVSLVLCGLIVPLVLTGVAQVLMPYQANGSIATFNGRNVGSNLIAQNFTKPIFFHARNDSASGVDPDITIQDALSQAERIGNYTRISVYELRQIVNQNVEGTLWIFGSQYVNVLRLNLILIQNYPVVYKNFQ